VGITISVPTIAFGGSIRERAHPYRRIHQPCFCKSNLGNKIEKKDSLCIYRSTDLCHNKKRKCHLPPGVQPNTGIACVTCAASKKKHKCSFEPEVTVSMHSVQQNQSAISDLVPLATATKKTSSGSSSKVIFDDATLDLIFGSIPPVNTTTATASDSITMLDTNNFSPSKAPDLDVSYLDTVESSPWPETSRASAASSTQTVGNETWEELLENFPVTQQEEDGKINEWKDQINNAG
ncbi:hypothetical protein BT69DRAFT_1300911, partial [Atractiella rhizophila]